MLNIFPIMRTHIIIQHFIEIKSILTSLNLMIGSLLHGEKLDRYLGQPHRMI